MEFFKMIVELLFSSGMIVNAILFIPQSIRIYKHKSSEGVSLVTFIGFLLIQLTIILHGMINHDFLLVFGYIFSIITCGAVIVLTIIYRYKKE